MTTKNHCWWCAHCAEEVQGRAVTYDERHHVCGHAVLWVPVRDAMTGSEARAIEAFCDWMLEANRVELSGQMLDYFEHRVKSGGEK